MKIENNNPITFKQSILKEKFKIILIFLSYLLFVVDQNQVQGLSEVFSELPAFAFFAVYLFFIFIMYSYIKKILPIYKDINVSTSKGKTKVYNVFIVLAIGSLLGFFTNIINALITTTFSTYITSF